MKKEYKVRHFIDLNYEVLEITTIYGERVSAYDSEPDETKEESVFLGNLSDCYSYILLCKGGYMQ